MTRIGSRIKELRNNAGLSQENFVLKINITRSHLSKIESGITTPSQKVIKAILNEYYVNEEWLREGKGGKFKVINPQTPEELQALNQYIKNMQPVTTFEYLKNFILDMGNHIIGSLNKYEIAHNKYYSTEFKKSRIYNAMRLYKDALTELQSSLSIELNNFDEKIETHSFQLPLMTKIEKSTLNLLRSLNEDSLTDFYALLVAKAARLEKEKMKKVRKDILEIQKASKYKLD